jgi:hypothetical protein
VHAVAQLNEVAGQSAADVVSGDAATRRRVECDQGREPVPPHRAHPSGRVLGPVRRAGDAVEQVLQTVEELIAGGVRRELRSRTRL